MNGIPVEENRNKTKNDKLEVNALAQFLLPRENDFLLFEIHIKNDAIIKFNYTTKILFITFQFIRTI